MINLAEICFHDAYIYGISVVTGKDHFDKISISLDSNTFISDFGTSKVSLQFTECFRAELQLQMWISGKDSIRELDIIDSDSSAEIRKINDLKEKGYIKKDDVFEHCEITLNTSGSKITIISKDINVIPE
jgi:hypothetical protein